MRILLVEDDPELARVLVGRLTAEGLLVDHLSCLGDAIEAVMSVTYKAVLLDRRLPDGDGLALLPVIRTRPAPPPVIILTAMDDVADRVNGLDQGAEDYLVKPFAFEELAARLRVLLRRGGTAAVPSLRIASIGQLRFDLTNREPTVDGETLALPRRELAILEALIRQAGRVVLREHLEAQVYGFADDISSNALEAHISRLRKRLADAGAHVVLHAVRGVGYTLRGA